MATRTTKKKVAAKEKAVAKKAPARKPSKPDARLRHLKVSAVDVKYIGKEPEWNHQPEENDRKVKLLWAFNWYNYLFDYKDAPKMVLDYLEYHEHPAAQIKAFKKVKPGSLPNSIAWLCRCSMKGLDLLDEEIVRIDRAVDAAIAMVHQPTQIELNAAEAKAAKAKGPTIQERMQERADEAGGEIEGMLDDFVAAGAPTKFDYNPISVLKIANILPQHVPAMITHWEKVAAEFKEAQVGEDVCLVEGYNRFSKLQLRALIKFAEQVVADLNSYITFKKATRAPRKRKVKTPEQLTAKLKYLKEFPELGLTSVKPAQIVGSKELFVYSTKKRKLQYYIADEHAGGMLTVKNNTIIGFDPMKSVQKTIRKPAEQIKAIVAASKPNTRKLFAATKAVETKLSGRFADDLVILKAF